MYHSKCDVLRIVIPKENINPDMPLDLQYGFSEITIELKYDPAAVADIFCTIYEKANSYFEEIGVEPKEILMSVDVYQQLMSFHYAQVWNCFPTTLAGMDIIVVPGHFDVPLIEVRGSNQDSFTLYWRERFREYEDGE